MRRSQTTLLGIVVTLSSSLAAAQDGSFAGVLSEITCRGEIKPFGGNSSRPLDANADKRLPLASGDQLRCNGDGQIVVQQGGLTKTGGPAKTIITKAGAGEKGNGQWVTVRRSPILNSIVRNTDAAFTRGDTDQQIYNPSEGGAVRAADAVVRWNPSPQMDTVIISLSQQSGRTLCCDGTFDGASGSFDSAELRRALLPIRDAAEADRELVLIVSSPRRRDFYVNFSVLSSAEETALDHDLSTWRTAKDPLLAHVGRAHVFAAHRLFAPAAEELEAALALSPRSVYLLEETASAERRSGNSVRGERLQTRLAAEQSEGSK